MKFEEFLNKLNLAIEMRNRYEYALKNLFNISDSNLSNNSETQRENG